VTIQIEEQIFWDCWMNWENELRWAHWQCEVVQGMLSWRLPSHKIMVGCLTDEEEARFGFWKAQYIYHLAYFEHEMMAARKFDLV